VARLPPPAAELVRDDVRRALAEDVGPGDLTASLIPGERRVHARVVAREPAVLAGQAWFDAAFRELDPHVRIAWHAADGERVAADAVLCELAGNARAIVSGERTALNFLQTLSGTATATARYVAAVAGTGAVILDTRKTLPGLRRAQKYAVLCGGARNHRIGLWDAVLIKENHIAAAGSISAAVEAVRGIARGRLLEVEVESLAELDEALAVGAERVLLDDFSPADMRAAVARAAGRCALEVSGSVTLERVREIAETGIDFISIGALTKHVHAIDLSLRVDAA
jgi:nicotinate-nucleotide pyrophosphorylase (carboxylating)